jgi:drug/metabolite transporter (DMT)-like permease
MKKFFFLGFALLMLFDALSQIFFKLTAMHALPFQVNIDWLERLFGHPWIYAAAIAYAGTFFTWMMLLKKLSIGSSFAASHVGVIGVMFVSYFVFNEPITAAKLLGAILILGGTVCLAIAEQKNHEKQGLNDVPN